VSLTAINDVTRALRMLLFSQLKPVSSSAVVTLHPPGTALPDASGVNLYLYRVIESPATKNRNWPGNRMTAGANAPVLALELSYLLTPLGKKTDDSSSDQGDDAHSMLGIAMGTLARYPVLNDVHLPGFDADAVLSPALLASFERLKVTLMPTDIETLSKIWATINQPYRLSIAYDVSLVELVPSDPLPRVGGAVVGRTALDVGLIATPAVDALEPPAGPLATVDGGGRLNAGTLTIRGSAFQLGGAATTVLFGGNPATIAAAPPARADALTVTLPLDLGAGPQADVVVRVGARGSAPVPFVVTPWLSRIVPLRTAFDPNVAATIALSGIGFGPPGAHVRSESATTATDLGPVAAGATDTAATVTLPASLANGTYTLRLVRAGGAATNGRVLEVIPLLAGVAVSVVHPAAADVHQLALTGARLDGTNVHVAVDGIDYAAPANPNAASLNYTLARKLQPGPHTARVSVDGALSHEVAFRV
jgi:Pvc16 N-terminal domain